MSDSDSRVAWSKFTEVVKAGGPLPAPDPVSPADLRRCWGFAQGIQKQHPPSAAGGVGIDIRVVEAELPGVDLPAVWLRATALQILHAHGTLNEWARGMDLDDVVFQVAAIFPFGGNQIDPEAFREQLRAASGAK